MRKKVQICKVILLAFTALYFVLCCCDCLEEHITTYTDNIPIVDVYGQNNFSTALAAFCAIAVVLILLERPILQLIAGLMAAFYGVTLPLKITIYEMLKNTRYYAIMPDASVRNGNMVMTPIGYCVIVVAWAMVAAQITFCVLLLTEKSRKEKEKIAELPF